MTRAVLTALFVALGLVTLNAQLRVAIKVPVVPTCDGTANGNEGVLELMSTTGTARTQPVPDTDFDWPNSYGYFTFNAPWNSRAVKISDTSTTADQIRQDGYNLWPAVSEPTGDCTQYAMISYGTAGGGVYVVSFNFETEASPVATQVATSGVLAASEGSGWQFHTTDPTLFYAKHSGTRYVYRCDIDSLPCNSPTQLIDVRSAAAIAAGSNSGASITDMYTCDDDHWALTLQLDGNTQAGALHRISDNSWTLIEAADLPDEDGLGEGFHEGQGDIYLTGDCARWNKAYIEAGGMTRQCLGEWGDDTCLQEMPGTCAWGHFAPMFSGWMAPNYNGCNGTSGAPPYLYWIGSTIGSMLSGTTALNGNAVIHYRPGNTNEDYGQPAGYMTTGGPSSASWFGTHSTRQSATQMCSFGRRFCELMLVKFDGSGHAIACAPTMASLASGMGDGQGTGSDNGATNYYQAPKPSWARRGNVALVITNVGTSELEAFVVNVAPCATRLLAWNGS